MAHKKQKKSRYWLSKEEESKATHELVITDGSAREVVKSSVTY